jgi:hypothetical protein
VPVWPHVYWKPETGSAGEFLPRTIRRARRPLNWELSSSITGDRLSTCDFPSAVDAILGKMDDALPDESFPAFLERRCGNPKNEKQRQTRPPAREEITEPCTLP